ncbi:MAG: methyltransferase domain-containing protein [Holophagaceae bacterium]|nr:methyltransferase domain-containing protein [Holophagaceae bacterium]
MTTILQTSADVESAVRSRYSEGAKSLQPELCCPVQYDPQFLKVIPQEVLERDYGCGDPSRYVRKGETVLDLGSGTGKIAFIAAQIVGAEGRVIGVDMNDDMLDLARRANVEVARSLGYDNVEFRKGRIQELELNLELLEESLKRRPVGDLPSLDRLNGEIARLRSEFPLVAAESVDVVVSNCVLNLVATEEKGRLFREIHRVLKRGGRAVISDIVSDREIPEALQQDPELWSGCISGSFQEEAFLKAFEDAGFYGITLEKWDAEPWQVVEGIAFRSVTVIAYKGKEGACWDHGQAVIYKGPWKQVTDDDGHVLHRGVPTAVCAKTFEIYCREPYAHQFEHLAPEAPLAEILPFPCGSEPLRRDGTGLKALHGTGTCGPNGCC